MAVSARAGLPVWIPDDVAGHCCSVPWTSKGYTEGAELMANRTIEALWRWSGEGELAGRDRRELLRARPGERGRAT